MEHPIAWTNPATPVGGTAITVAFYSTNVRDNLDYLKGRAGLITLESDVLIPNNTAYQGKDNGGTQRSIGRVGSDNWVYFGDAVTAGVVLVGPGNADAWYSKGGSWKRLWHDGNDGHDSGLDADTVDGQHASAFAPAGDYTRTVTGNYTGNGGTTGRQITVGFIPKIVHLWNGTTGSTMYIILHDSGSLRLVSSGNPAFSTGVKMHASDGFTVGDGNTNGNDNGETYRWVASR